MVLRGIKTPKACRGTNSTKSTRKNLVDSSAPLAVKCKELGQSEAEDVIDLGAPRLLRATPALRLPLLYTPNPRLYPGSVAKGERRQRSKHRRRPRKHAFVRSVPNPRLYRPGPGRRVRAAEAGRGSPAARGRSAPLGSGASAPAPALCDLPPRAAGAMAASKYSTSPDCSDGNDGSSAPSEFLAEFLSAIMRRQYAEALKYCQLILQYEPHNSTARGFYPLLQHKVKVMHDSHAAEETSSSEETGSRRAKFFNAHLRQSVSAAGAAAGAAAEDMEQGSGSACSSLELDSSASPSPRASPPRSRTERSDRSDSSSWRWESGGERSDRDDNGNPAPSPGEGAASAAQEDLENDNAHTKSELESPSALRRLRAHFACSIK